MVVLVVIDHLKSVGFYMELMSRNVLNQYALHGTDSSGQRLYFGGLDKDSYIRFFDFRSGDLGSIEFDKSSFGPLIRSHNYDSYLFIIYMYGYVIIDCDGCNIYDSSTYHFSIAITHCWVGRGLRGPIFTNQHKSVLFEYDIASRTWLQSQEYLTAAYVDKNHGLEVSYDYDLANIPSYVTYGKNPLVTYAIKIAYDGVIRWYHSQLLSFHLKTRMLYFQSAHSLIEVSWDSGEIVGMYSLPSHLSHMHLSYGSMGWINDQLGFIRAGAKGAFVDTESKSIHNIDGLIVSHSEVPYKGLYLLFNGSSLLRFIDAKRVEHITYQHSFTQVFKGDKITSEIHL